MKNILSVGYQIPGYSDKYVPFNSDQSLLDADVIIFQPDFGVYSKDYLNPYYQGKPSFDENESFRIKEDSSHWKKELHTALVAGKTIFVFFSRFEEIVLHTGQRNYQGTGRNARIINIVSLSHNYTWFPVELPSIVPKSGSEIIFKNIPEFAILWKEFKSDFKYESYIDGKANIPIFVTKTGQKPVGAVFRIALGNLILLPPIRYDEEEFTKYDAKKKESFWTKSALQFGDRLVKVLVDIDNVLSASVKKTPSPAWVHRNEYKTAEESLIRKAILQRSAQINKLLGKKTALESDLNEELILKDLLYEKGKPLQEAVKRALRTLGYKAEGFREEDLEIDQIFTSPEGNRFVGETEGKDNAAVSIDKFRQLESNIQEDLQREEVEEPAIGALFGDGFRLKIPEKRESQFTKKCLKNAERISVVLIQTADLFEVANYINGSGDKNFAAKCRKAILDGRGKIVIFPDIPLTKEKQISKRTIKVVKK